MILQSARTGPNARRWTSLEQLLEDAVADVEHAGLHQHGRRIENVYQGGDADRQELDGAVDLGVRPHLAGADQLEGRGEAQQSCRAFAEIMPASARSEATVSRQPTLPHPQRRPLGSTVMCPISPARPLCPTMICPPLMTAPPSPRRGVDEGEIVHAAGCAEGPLAQAKGVGLVDENRGEAQPPLANRGRGSGRPAGASWPRKASVCCRRSISPAQSGPRPASPSCRCAA